MARLRYSRRRAENVSTARTRRRREGFDQWICANHHARKFSDAFDSAERRTGSFTANPAALACTRAAQARTTSAISPRIPPLELTRTN